MDLLLYVERRRLGDQGLGVLLVLPAPHELRVEVPVAALVGDLNGMELLALHHGLVFGRGNVLAGVLVGDRRDRFRLLGF